MTSTTRKTWRPGRGSVALIVALFASSALLRVASGVAYAEDAGTKPLPLPAVVGQTAMNTGHREVRRSLDRAEMGSLLEALQSREARIQERENQIELRSKALSVADQEITRRLSALQEAEEALRNTLSLADGAAEDDLARLTSVYESMKPKQAAALFETMEPAFAAGFLGRMRPDIAASVLAGLTPEVAYSISVILAGRNATVPKT